MDQQTNKVYRYNVPGMFLMSDDREYTVYYFVINKTHYIALIKPLDKSRTELQFRHNNALNTWEQKHFSHPYVYKY